MWEIMYLVLSVGKYVIGVMCGKNVMVFDENIYLNILFGL